MTTLLPPVDLTAVVGPVLRPGDPGLRTEIAGFNLTFTPTPALVVGATCTADVAAAVRYAASVGKRVAVQATGHGLVSDLHDTVLVTTRRMADVLIDPVAHTARVAAGVRWRAVIDAAAEHGLAPLSGSSSQVGVVGYTTGGGLGPLCRRYGFAADHVTRFTIVTADGAVRDVRAESTDPDDVDLFWAVRGGKGSFGIVTEIEFGLVPVTTFHGGAMFFAGEDAATVMHAWRQWAPTLPEDTTTSVALLRLPPAPELPEPLRGRFVVAVRFTHIGQEGPALLAPMRAVAPMIMDAVADLPFPAIDAVHMDPTDPMPVWDRGVALSALPAAAVDAVLAQAGPGVTSPLSIVEIRLLGGALARQPRIPNAVTGRDAAFSVFTAGVTLASSVEAVAAAGAGVVEALRPWANGCLINFLGQAGPERVGQLWSPADRARLVAIRERFDPAALLATNVVVG
ncbi:MAG: FAD-binding oxidoreductase [Pseudonocardia sp.]|nr:FAD-binding oxidoreductase [Pseudonocardia sp.]